MIRPVEVIDTVSTYGKCKVESDGGVVCDGLLKTHAHQSDGSRFITVQCVVCGELFAHGTWSKDTT